MAGAFAPSSNPGYDSRPFSIQAAIRSHPGFFVASPFAQED